MKQLPILLLLLLTTGHLIAQDASLSDTELGNLKQLISSDTAIAAAFKPYHELADRAISEEPAPIITITSQGLLEGNPEKAASLRAVKDADKAYAMALVYRLYHQRIYLDKDSALLMAWVNTNVPTGDPIDATKLEAMVTGYDLLRSTIKKERRATIDVWMMRIYDSLANSASAKNGRTTGFNNWNSHRLKMMALIACTLHNAVQLQILDSLLKQQIAANLNADGSSFDFTERDAFHYHIYDLEPLLTAAIILHRTTGKDYFRYTTASGASIAASVTFMTPYMTGEKQHGEFVNSKVDFDRKRAANGEKGYAAGSLFQSQAGIGVFALAAYFNAGYLSVIQKASTGNTQYPDWQLVLNRVRKASALRQQTK